MRKCFSKRKKLTISVIMIVTAFVVWATAVVVPVWAESATGTKVTYKGSVSSMGSTCGKFTIKGRDAFCAEHSKPTPPTGTKITSTKQVTKASMRKALYYGYGGPEAKVSKNNAGWVSTSIALSRANGKGGGTAKAQKFYKKLSDYKTPPESFKVYICNTAGGLQDLCYWIYEPAVSLSQIPTTEVEQQPIRGDLEIIKSDEMTGKRMPGVTFDVIDASDNKVAATLVTDENGYATTAMESEPNGSLAYGTYIVREKETPIGYLPADDITVSITEQNETITLDIVNIPAEIGTTAYFKENNLKDVLPAETVTIIDEVRYKNLIPGKEYKLSGVLMDTDTGETLLVNGEGITSEMNFTPESSEGSVHMEFMIDASDLSGKSVTVFERLYIEDALIASHEDITDEGQTVSFIAVGDIEIYKGDKATGEPLEGVEFQVIDRLNGEVVAELVTDDLGYATTASDENVGGTLLLGDYIVRETEPLPGYLPIEDIYVTLDDFNKVISLKIDNVLVHAPDEEVPETGDPMERIIPLTIALLIFSFMGALVTVRRRDT